MLTGILRRLSKVESPKVESFEDVGWEVCDNYEPDAAWVDLDCPRCDGRWVTTHWQTWSNDDTDEWTNVDFYWCANGHMWTYVDSSQGESTLTV
ncbi:hypothetical protein [Mycobacteroides abscessus]|uniref:hypothetical protein n=1 Tax=Mycobacteroides abscessus TaxID=36809 RepID=UPI000C2643D0|nr:hypothetical protein [Mycobacteroides abscessus]